jgi:hypothetical protein
MRMKAHLGRVLRAVLIVAVIASVTPCVGSVSLTPDEQKQVSGGCTVSVCIYQGGCMWPYYFDAPPGTACMAGSGPNNYPTWGCHGAAKVPTCTTWPTGQECGYEIMGLLDDNHQCTGYLYKVETVLIHCYYCK